MKELLQPPLWALEALEALERSQISPYIKRANKSINGNIVEDEQKLSIEFNF